MKYLKDVFIYDSKDRLRQLAYYALLLLLFCNVLNMLWYVWVGYKAFFHSDAAVKNLLAQEILATGSYFPREWNFVNGDLWVFGGHTFILPLLKFFPNGFNLHAFSGVITAILILWGSWLLTKLLQLKRIFRVLFLALVVSGLSSVSAGILYGEGAYGGIYYTICFFLYWAWQSLEAESGKRKYFCFGVFIISGVVFWENPMRGLVMYALPLSAALFVYLLRSRKEDSGGQIQAFTACRNLAGAFLLGAILGILLHLWTLSKIINVKGVAAARWLSPSAMFDNLGYTLQGLLALLGGSPEAGTTVISGSGIYAAGGLFAALILVVLIPVSIYRLGHRGRSAEQFAAVFAGVSLALILFVQIATTVPDMGDPAASARYLIPALILSLLMVITLFQADRRSVLPGYLGIGACIFLSLSAFSAFGLPDCGLSRSQASYPERLGEFLVSHKLEYGYATFWNAGALTVLSDSRVKVRQITFYKKLPVPYRWLSSDRWYRSAAWSGKSFLILTPGEEEMVDWQALEHYNGVSREVLDFQGVKIFVYDHNLAESLPGWDMNRYKFPVTSKSCTQIGNFVPVGKESSLASLVAQAGAAGYLHFGPYSTVKPGVIEHGIIKFDIINPGEYRAIFALSLKERIGAESEVDEERDKNKAFIDVSCNFGKTVFGRKMIKSANDKAELIVDLKPCKDLEFRVYSFGLSPIEFSGVTLERVSP